MMRAIEIGPTHRVGADAKARLVGVLRYAALVLVLVASVVGAVLLSPVLLVETLKGRLSRRQARESDLDASALASWATMPLRAVALMIIASVMGLALAVMTPLLGVHMIKNSLIRSAEKRRERGAGCPTPVHS